MALRPDIAGDVRRSANELIDAADALLLAEESAARPQRPMVSNVIETFDDTDINAVRSGRQRQDRGNSGRPRQSRLAFLNPAGICGYHDKWGEQAKSCVDGCRFRPKNAQGGR